MQRLFAIINLKPKKAGKTSMSIDFDLEDLEGIKSAKTSYAKQESEIEFDEEKVDLTKIIQTIKKTGYDVQVAM